MKFFKSRTGAAMVLALAVVFSVLFGSHRSLTAEREQVEALFYTGADGGGSIASDLKERRNVAANLVSVAGRYVDGPALADLSAAVQGMDHADGITQLYDWNLALEESAQEVLALLEGEDLSEKDARYVRGFRADLASRADTIARDPYHAAAEKFNQEVLGGFPANVLGPATGVEPVPLFEAPGEVV